MQTFKLNNLLKEDYKNLSGGQKQYVRLCLILFGEYNLIFFDVPTSFLDFQKTAWLIKYIRESKKAFLIVSHDVDFLSKIAEKFFDIDNFQINSYFGDYDAYLQSKRDFKARTAQNNTTANNKMALLDKSIYAQKEWMKQAENKHKHKVLIDRLEMERRKEMN
ncbi:MAG: hypothetical protein LUE12_07060 [Ruminococcus sp.]|nr:hypothetical protein [Ruminococcus sp.]